MLKLLVGVLFFGTTFSGALNEKKIKNQILFDTINKYDNILKECDYAPGLYKNLAMTFVSLSTTCFFLKNPAVAQTVGERIFSGLFDTIITPGQVTIGLSFLFCGLCGLRFKQYHFFDKTAGFFPQKKMYQDIEKLIQERKSHLLAVCLHDCDACYDIGQDKATRDYDAQIEDKEILLGLAQVPCS